MTEDSDSKAPARRDIFRLAAASAVGLGFGGAAQAQVAASAPITLTAPELRILEAFCARLVPSDAMGPGAAEAHAARYIDQALGGALAASRQDYRAGLAALDAYARSSKGNGFADLPGAVQDAVLTDVEKNTATGFSPDGATFFALVRGHTLQGMFGDPVYGGNADGLGWTLIGYPGIRLAVSKEEQAMGAHLTPIHKSAYDFPMFRKLNESVAKNPAPVDNDHMPDGMGNMPNDH